MTVCYPYVNMGTPVLYFKILNIMIPIKMKIHLLQCYRWFLSPLPLDSARNRVYFIVTMRYNQ